MSTLKELEKRLKEEPENLGLRVLLASAMREAGRQGEAVELYRSVALGYRDQGRTHQAIAVCRSILEVVPDDVRCHALLASLVAGQPEPRTDAAAATPRESPPPLGPAPLPGAAGEMAVVPTSPPPRSRPKPPPPPGARPAPASQHDPPLEFEVRGKTADVVAPPQELPTLRPRGGSITPAPIPSISVARSKPSTAPDQRAGARSREPMRRSSFDETPLPSPLPYHVADPTTRSLKKLSDFDLPVSENAPTRPGSEDSTALEVTGIANAARRISASLSGSASHDDLSIELDTRQHPRVAPVDLIKISGPPPTGPVERVELDDDALTPAPDAVPGVCDSDEELTRPRDLPLDLPRARPAAPPAAPRGLGGPLDSAFFSPLPSERRAEVLARFLLRPAVAGSTVIRQGAQGHGLVLVASGRLAIRAERPDGRVVQLGAIEAGDYVGEAALLARAPAPAHVIALTDAELLVLPPRDFYEIAGAFPALWAELKDVAERRTRGHEARLRR